MTTVLVLDGGLVQSVHKLESGDGFVCIDYDVEGLAPEDLTEIPQYDHGRGGDVALAYYDELDRYIREFVLSVIR